MKNLLLSLFISNLLFVGCQNEAEILPKEYPTIVTMRPTEINERGAIFVAEVVSEGVEEVTEYGFILKTNEKKSINDPDKIIKFRCKLTAEFPKDSFKYHMYTDIKYWQSYSLTAYAITEQYQIRGQEVAFAGRGSMKPQIDRFYPLRGGEETQVTLYGKYFSKVKDNIEVFLNNSKCEILSVDLDSIVVNTPKNTPSGHYKFKVENAGGISFTTDEFELFYP